jgi:hypothetical protein
MPMSGIKVVEACSTRLDPVTGTFSATLARRSSGSKKPMEAMMRVAGRLPDSRDGCQIPGDQSQQAVGHPRAQELGIATNS